MSSAGRRGYLVDESSVQRQQILCKTDHFELDNAPSGLQDDRSGLVSIDSECPSRQHPQSNAPLASEASLNKRVPNGDAALDHLPVLQILGIQRVAVGLEGRCSD